MPGLSFRDEGVRRPAPQLLEGLEHDLDVEFPDEVEKEVATWKDVIAKSGVGDDRFDDVTCGYDRPVLEDVNLGNKDVWVGKRVVTVGGGSRNQEQSWNEPNLMLTHISKHSCCVC